MTHTTDKERAEFEAWARWACYDIARAGSNAQYESNITEQVWQCWKARAALEAQAKQVEQA